MDFMQLLLQSKLLKLATLVSIAYCFFTTIKKLYEFFWKIRHFRSFPQSKSNFFIGHTKQLLPSVSDFVRDQSAKFPNESFVTIWLGWYPMIVCIDYRSAEAIFSQPNHSRGTGHKIIGLRDGLVLSHGPKWKARRRMIEPFFSTKKLSSYISAMNDSYEKMTRDMAEKKIQSIDMANYIHKTSLDIILKTTMTIPNESEQQNKEQLIKDLETVEKIIVSRFRNPILWPDWYFYLTEMGNFAKAFEEKVDRFMEPRITERIGRVFEKETRNDFIDLLLNHYNPNTTDFTSTIDMEGMKEEILNLILAGHDTIAAGLRWTLFLLGNYLQCQDKLYDEIINTIGDSQILTDLQDINRLTYLDQCIKEAMRLCIPTPLTLRSLEVDTVIGKYLIPKGTDIVCSLYNIHRDSKVWDNPDIFDPDRFSPERFSKIPKYAYMPFGQGKRNCIGQRFAMIEMKLFLVHFIRSYSFVSTQSVDQVEFVMDVTLKPKTPLTIKLTPRNISF